MTKKYINYIYTSITFLFISVTTYAQQSDELGKSNVKDKNQDSNAEVIDLGLGIVRSKLENSAAISTVTADDLSDRMNINPANALFGKIPGLSVMQSGGLSWENDPRLFIRGNGTVRDASIMVLIDGFERPLSSLSMGEIESISVLKDAAALAIYGMRGANGVLLVNTKRGNANRDKVTVSYELGVTQAQRIPKFLDSYGYATAINQARSYDGLGQLYNHQMLEAFQTGSSPYNYPNVNWSDEAFRDLGKTNNFMASFQGEIPSTRYFASLNYQSDNGMLGPVNDNEGYNTQLNNGKFNFRSNVDVALTKSTTLKAAISGNLRETNTPGTSIADIMHAVYHTPAAAYPVRTPAGIWGGTANFNNNPIAQISATGYRTTQARQFYTDGIIEQRLDMFVKGLAAEAAISYDNSALFSEGKVKQYRYQSITMTNNGGVLQPVTAMYGNDTELSYYHNLADQWARATVQGRLKYNTEWNDQILQSNIVAQRDKMLRSGQNNTFIRQMISGNVHYSKASKYFADLSFSYSGTNRLPKNDRYALFPAVSVGWKISEESWFTNPVVNDLKVRGSWGMTGNDLIPLNLYQVQYHGSAPYFFTNNSNASGGAQEGRLPSNVTHELSTKYNLGIDASLFSKLDLNVDVFFDRRSNILVESDGIVSSVIGVTKPLIPQGIVDNKGIETALKFYDSKGDFSYHLQGQFAFVRNKIVNIGEAFQPFDYLKRTGRAIGQAYGLESLGFFNDRDEIANNPLQTFSPVKSGDVKYKDQNNDKIIDSNDEVPIGYNTVNPEIYYSGSFGVAYKGLGLDVLFQGAANRTVYLSNRSVFWPLIGNSNISEFSAGNTWTPETAETATLPRLTTLDNANNYRPNSIWIVDGSFLKLRTVMLHYTFSKEFASKLRLSNLRLVGRGMDLLTFDKIKVVDPEVLGTNYPAYATYSFGIQIGF